MILTGGSGFLFEVWVVECVFDLCCPSPHVWKIGLFDLTLTVFARGVSKGVH